MWNLKRLWCKHTEVEDYGIRAMCVQHFQMEYRVRFKPWPVNCKNCGKFVGYMNLNKESFPITREV